MTASRPILVGVDGSEDSRRALAWAAELGAALGCEVVAAHALGLLAHLGSPVSISADEHREEIRALIEGEWTSELRSGSVAWRCLLLEGSPVTALASAALDEDAFVVVVARRGSGGFAGLQLGSTSHQLIQHCARPVVVVPATTTDSVPAQL